MVKQNKKSIREVFDFFPNAKWMAQDRLGLRIYTKPMKPEIHDFLKGWYQFLENRTQFHQGYSLNESIIKIDWGNRRTWKQRIVSRSEAMDEN